jgi:formamidopyrimidine-DNA glycosylase
MIFDDVRTFGKIQIFGIDDEVSSIKKLGVEPLSEEFDFGYLHSKIKKRKAPIKNLLLDQTIIAGLGNIYVCEVLLRVGVNPTTSGNELSKKKTTEIIKKIKEVLLKAIECNGTSISDYRNVDNKTGDFQKFLQIYGKEKCHVGHSVSRIKQAGRSTYFCPKCQK